MNDYDARLEARRKQFDEAIAEKLRIKAERKKIAKPIVLRTDADGNVYGPNGTLLGRASR